MSLRLVPLLFLALTATAAPTPVPFRFPTSNTALLDPAGGDKFFAGTAGKDWTSGQFGCVRTSGNQMHEGLDIKCLTRDRHGEPADPVMATAEGKIVYLNPNSALSNYGRYIVIEHSIDGLEIYSVYAHLHSFQPGLKPGDHVSQGQTIATMGRTSNTRQPITKDRAHVHFELNVFLSPRFAEWYHKNFPNQRNDHGQWNGQNLAGLDPRLILLAEHKNPAGFSLLQFVREQTELCRVLVRSQRLPFAQRYARLVLRNPISEKEGISGFEISLNYNGVPFRIVPRAASEIKTSARFELLSVNSAEQTAHPCRHLVARRGDGWVLTNKGEHLLDLLTY